MALYQSRNQMSTNKVNAQAQMLLLLNKVQNLESQLGQRNDQGMDMLGLMNQLKSLQGKVPRREVPVKPQPNMNLGGLLTGLLGSIEGSKPEGTRCVWVTGLPDEYVDADVLCNIFGNFGNVIKVQFTEKNPDAALIELDHPHSANRAVRSMNQQKLSGQEIEVSERFNMKEIRASIKAADTKSKDFRQEKSKWRYPSSRTDNKFRKICLSRMRQLTPKLLVANIPDGKIDDVKKYMVQRGFTVKEIEESKRRTDDTKEEKPSTGFTAAKVELASTEEAISAVGTLHGTWPTTRNFGSKKVDKFGNSCGLVMTFMSPPRENKSKA